MLFRQKIKLSQTCLNATTYIFFHKKGGLVMTASPGDELVWIVDEKNRPLGSATRREMREKRLIHRSTYILVADSAGRLLVQKRTTSKDVYPGLWEIAAGGVVNYGEEYLPSAIRELKEETGIRGVELQEHLDFFYEDSENRLWGRLFSCTYDGEIRPQPEEVAEARFVDKWEMAELLSSERFTPDSYFVIELIKKEKIKPFERLFLP